MLLWKSFKLNLMVCSKSNINLIKQIHDVVRLFSNWSQVTLKCREKKKSGTRGTAEWVIDATYFTNQVEKRETKSNFEFCSTLNWQDCK